MVGVARRGRGRRLGGLDETFTRMTRGTRGSKFLGPPRRAGVWVSGLGLGFRV
jgi:hypothetical protein